MTQAENFVAIYEGGNRRQALELANNLSTWVEEDPKTGSKVFALWDASAVYTKGDVFRVATKEDVSP